MEDRLWSAHDPALFRQCLRLFLQYRSISFYNCFDTWAGMKTDENQTSNEISLLWLSDSLEHLVGVYIITILKTLWYDAI